MATLLDGEGHSLHELRREASGRLTMPLLSGGIAPAAGKERDGAYSTDSRGSLGLTTATCHCHHYAEYGVAVLITLQLSPLWSGACPFFN